LRPRTLVASGVDEELFVINDKFLFRHVIFFIFQCHVVILRLCYII